MCYLVGIDLITLYMIEDVKNTVLGLIMPQ